jgi:hypothetical protein
MDEETANALKLLVCIHNHPSNVRYTRYDHVI